jgi:hypothetical protein
MTAAFFILSDCRDIPHYALYVYDQVMRWHEGRSKKTKKLVTVTFYLKQ